MILEAAALAFVAQKVLDHVADDITAGTLAASTRQVRAWLGREPQQLATQRALARVANRLAAEYGARQPPLLDATFLAGPAAPLLARELTRSQRVTAAELSELWGVHLGGATGQRHAKGVEPAARDLLAWWREELGRHEPFRQALDSRSLDDIAASGGQTVEAIHVLRTDLTASLNQLDRTLTLARYPELKDYVNWPSREQVRWPAPFVGRAWLFHHLESLRRQHASAYVSVVAEAGLGKTAIAAAVAGRYGAPAFFFVKSAGRTRADQCLNHLSVELIDRYGLPHDHLPDRAGEDAGFLLRLLEEATATGDCVWLVVDALDEMQTGAATSLALPLPERLPAGAFIVLTHRPGDYAPLVPPGSGTVQREIRLRTDDADQRRDVASYIRQRVASEPVLREALSHISASSTLDELVALLTTASEGNFMYLAYVLDDIGAGQLQVFDPDRLPVGLAGYYANMWNAIAMERDRDWHSWHDLHLPVIERLVVAGEPVALEWLATHIAKPPYEVLKRALQPWRRFLGQTNHPVRWHIVHQSFRDFLADSREVDLPGSHRAVAGYYLGDGDRWRHHDGYALRCVCAHLRQAGSHDELFRLVRDPEWRRVQAQADPTRTNLINDLATALEAASD